MLWGRGIVFSMLWCLLALRLLLANSCPGVALFGCSSPFSLVLPICFRMLVFLFYTVAYGSIRDDKEKTENQWKNYLVSLRFPSRFHTQLAVPWFSFKPFCFSNGRGSTDWKIGWSFIVEGRRLVQILPSLDPRSILPHAERGLLGCWRPYLHL